MKIIDFRGKHVLVMIFMNIDKKWHDMKLYMKYINHCCCLRCKRMSSFYEQSSKYEEMLIDLRDFGLQTIRHLCPCALCGVAKRGFPIGDSRLSRRSNATFFYVYSVTPLPARIWSVFLQNRCSRCGGGRRCAPDHLFSRQDRPSAPSGPKVCRFIIEFVCNIRKLQ